MRERIAGIFPRGPLDFLLQLAIWFGFGFAYQIARGIADREQVAQAFANGRTIIDFERWMHGMIELDLQGWALRSDALMHALNWTYWLSQFAVVGLALLWIYFWRNNSFRGVRNWLIAANLIGLVGYVLMPTAPPRMFPEWGFIDSLADSAALNHGTGFIQLAANPYAAMPSLHGADALIIGISMYGLVKSRWAKALWLLWPAWVWFAVMATANHFWLDIAAGVAIAGVAYVALAWWENREKTPELAPAPNERC